MVFSKSNEASIRNEERKDLLLLNCSLCPQNIKARGDYKKEQKCFLCILNRLENIQKTPKSIEINGIYKIPEDDIAKFIAIDQYLKNTKALIKKFYDRLNKSCMGVDNFCILPDVVSKAKSAFSSDEKLQFLGLSSFILLNPVKMRINRTCNSCIKNLNPFMVELRKNIDIVHERLGIALQSNENSNSLLEIILGSFYGFIPINELGVLKKIQNEDLDSIFGENKELLENYLIKPDNLYEVEIFQIPYKYEKYYQLKSLFSESEWEIVNNLRPTIFIALDKLNFFEQHEIGEVIEVLEKEISQLISTSMNISDVNLKRKIVRFLSTNYVKIDEIFPLLVDNYIEEIFLDSVGDYIYLNHQKYGRCRTGIKMSLESINSLKTHIRLESRERLDKEHSSIVYVIKNKFFHCRFSIDIAPIHYENQCLDIRKINKRTFTLIDLISNNTITKEIAAFLYFCLRRRINITVIGETDSGKTTLINALDLLVPTQFRKIYLEDVLESLDHRPYNHHQLKYVVSGGAESSEQTKAAQIKKLLHRSPDFVYLGEILTREECEAMFHCLSAGLKGLQTSHGFDIYSTITRWEIHFGVPKLCFNDLGIVITMKKHDNRRFVTGIYELEYIEPNLIIREFFKYDPFKNDWIKKDSFKESKAFKQIASIEALTPERLEFEIDNYIRYFGHFVDSGEYLNQNIEELIAFFEKVDYCLRLNLPLPEISEVSFNPDFQPKKPGKLALKNIPVVVEEYGEKR